MRPSGIYHVTRHIYVVQKKLVLVFHIGHNTTNESRRMIYRRGFDILQIIVCFPIVGKVAIGSPMYYDGFALGP